MALIALNHTRRLLRGLRGNALPRRRIPKRGPNQHTLLETGKRRPRKWLLLYNCQFLGLANCLHLLSDDIEVEAHRPDVRLGNGKDPTRRGGSGPPWTRQLGQYEQILVFPGLMEAYAHFGLAGRDNIHRVPGIFFDGFHPDFCQLQHRGSASGEDKAIPRGVWPGTHSLIGAVAFEAGLDVPQTRALYNEEIYERLGYFDRWAGARDHLLHKFSQAGWDLRKSFLAWSHQGAFMHTSRHPHIHCLRDLALLFLDRFDARVSPCPFLPPDNLAHAAIDPIYPELGRRIGVPGSYRFKTGNSFQTNDLQTYLKRRFAFYRSMGPFELANVSRHLQPAAETLREILA